jgi:hypothetical protein
MAFLLNIFGGSWIKMAAIGMASLAIVTLIGGFFLHETGVEKRAAQSAAIAAKAEITAKVNAATVQRQIEWQSTIKQGFETLDQRNADDKAAWDQLEIDPSLITGENDVAIPEIKSLAVHPLSRVNDAANRLLEQASGNTVAGHRRR